GKGAFAACLGADVGAMRATDVAGAGIQSLSSRTSWWFAATSGLAVALPASRGLVLRFRLAVGVPFPRPSFFFEHVGANDRAVEVYRPAPIFAVVTLEPEIRFFSTDAPSDGHVPP